MPDISSGSLTEIFSSCTFSLLSKDVSLSSPVSVVGDEEQSEAGYHATAYYVDSSGRSSFVLPISLTCASRGDVEKMLEARCLNPMPSNMKQNNDPPDDAGERVSSSLPSNNATIRFEVKSEPTDHGKEVTVESITILSCKVQGTSFLFEIEVVVRATSETQAFVTPMKAPLQRKFLSREISKEMQEREQEMNAFASTEIEVTPLLVMKKKTNKSVSSSTTGSGLPRIMAIRETGNIPLPDRLQPLSSLHANQTKLHPTKITLSLTHALSVSVRNVNGSNAGSTLVSLTVKHSNTHSEPVTITNIALHPGHSRQEEDLAQQDRSMAGGHLSVTDMSKYVKWKYAPQTEPNLPLTLQPHEAYSTVILIDAGEDLTSRSFYSPVSVTAFVGHGDNEDDARDDNSDDVGVIVSARRPCVVVGADARWTTGRIAVEPADAFRVDMSVGGTQSSSCAVGAPLVISLRVLNLSHDTKDLMLLMAKDENEKAAQKGSAVNTAVVSEVNGYTFGVWGLSGDDDGTVRHNRDHELLAVDAALLLGEVKGQHSVDAELRFVPLREGTLNVPNFKLYDKTEGRWYNCIHQLQLVAAAAKKE